MKGKVTSESLMQAAQDNIALLRNSSNVLQGGENPQLFADLRLPKRQKVQEPTLTKDLLESLPDKSSVIDID